MLNILDFSCKSYELVPVIKALKKFLNIIQIWGPILLLIVISILFFRLAIIKDDKEEKKLLKNVKNSIVALVILFFIPMIVNLLFQLMGENFSLSSCWNNAENITISSDSTYQETEDDNKNESHQIYTNQSEYEKGMTAGKKIAKLAVALSPTADPSGHLSEPNAYPWNKINDSRLNNFYEVMDTTIGQYHDNNAYASCAQAAAGIIRATVDPDFETAGPDAQIEYLNANTEKWKYIDTVKNGEKFDDKCKPGDLLVCHGGHTMIYVGNKYAREKFPNTNGNMFQAGYSEGDHANYPSIDNFETSYTDFYIYRPTGKGKFTHPFIDISKYLIY